MKDNIGMTGLNFWLVSRVGIVKLVEEEQLLAQACERGSNTSG